MRADARLVGIALQQAIFCVTQNLKKKKKTPQKVNFCLITTQTAYFSAIHEHGNFGFHLQCRGSAQQQEQGGGRSRIRNAGRAALIM